MNEDFDDWAVQGAEEDQQRMEMIFAVERAHDEAEAAKIEAEGREYDARQKQKVELVKELNELRKTYDPLRQKLEDLESLLHHLYGWDWVKGDPEEDPYDPHPGYPEGATKEQMQSQDMEDEIDYISVTLDKYEKPIQINNQSQFAAVHEIPF